MSFFNEHYASSLELPNPADFPGQTVLCYERGVDQLCPWFATGSETRAYWHPLSFSYHGPASGLPAANKVRAGARAWITDDDSRKYSNGTTWLTE